MTALLRAVAVCAAALSLVVAAGCGGSSTSSNDYVTALNKAQTDFAASVRKVGSSSAGGNPTASAKKTFSDLSAATDKVVADLKAVEPPDKVKDLHQQLISEMTQFRAQVKAAGDSLTSNDPNAILSAQSKFASSASSLGARISKTIGDINAKLQG